MSSLTISIDRTSLALAPLVLSGVDDATTLGVVDYQEPAIQARIMYAPDSAYVPGSVPLAATWQQTLLSFAVVTDRAATEAASRTAITSLRDAVSQFAYEVTVTVGDAPAETWACDMGSLTPDGSRDLVNLEEANPVWNVTIPCSPVREVA